MTVSKLTRQGTTDRTGDVIVRVEEVYKISELPNTGSLSDLEILALAQAPDSGTPVAGDFSVRSGLTLPRFRINRNLASKHQATIRVVWGRRYSNGGGVISVQGFGSDSIDRTVLQPYLKTEDIDVDGVPATILSLDFRQIDRMITTSVYRRLLDASIPVESVEAMVNFNRRRLYTFGGEWRLLLRHKIVQANATQFYVDTFFITKSALPPVLADEFGTGTFPIDELPVLGEYVDPVPFTDNKTHVKGPEELYQLGLTLPWL